MVKGLYNLFLLGESWFKFFSDDEEIYKFRVNSELIAVIFVVCFSRWLYY